MGDFCFLDKCSISQTDPLLKLESIRQRAIKDDTGCYGERFQAYGSTIASPPPPLVQSRRRPCRLPSPRPLAPRALASAVKAKRQNEKIERPVSSWKLKESRDWQWRCGTVYL